MNGSSSTVFRQHNSSGGGQDRECGNVIDYNKTPFHENVLQTHIGYIGVAGKNPYGSVGTDRACDIWKGWTDMTSIQSAHLGKKCATVRLVFILRPWNKMAAIGK